MNVLLNRSKPLEGIVLKSATVSLYANVLYHLHHPGLARYLDERTTYDNIGKETYS